MIDIIPEENKKIIKDITKAFLSKRYFYCAEENCKNINSGMFKVTVFNVFSNDGKWLADKCSDSWRNVENSP